MGTEQRIQVPITKIDDERRIYGGWAYVAKTADGAVAVDHSGDVIDTPEAWTALVDSFYQYALVGRDGDEMHQTDTDGALVTVSKLAEFFVSDPERWEQLGIPEGAMPQGVFVSYHTDSDEVWGKVKDGTYRSLSIVGTGSREAINA